MELQGIKNHSTNYPPGHTHIEALQVVSWHPSAGELQLLIRHVPQVHIPTDTKHLATHAHQKQGLGYIWWHVQYLPVVRPEGPKAGDLQPDRWVEIRGWDKHYIGQHICVT